MNKTQYFREVLNNTISGSVTSINEYIHRQIGSGDVIDTKEKLKQEYDTTIGKSKNIDIKIFNPPRHCNIIFPTTIGTIQKFYTTNLDHFLSTNLTPQFIFVKDVPAFEIGKSIYSTNCVVQVASQYNFLESKDDTYSEIYGYFDDPTQGPDASLSCLSALVLRDYFFRPKILDDYKDSICKAQPIFDDLSEDTYRNGYLKLYNLNDKDLKKLNDNLDINNLNMLFQNSYPVYNNEVITQVFTAAPSYQEYFYLDRDSDSYKNFYPKVPEIGEASYKICEKLMTAQYEAIAQFAVLKSYKTKKLVNLHLTLVGQGAYNNNENTLNESFKRVIEIVTGKNVRVFIHIYKPAEIIIKKPTLFEKIMDIVRRSSLLYNSSDGFCGENEFMKGIPYNDGTTTTIIEPEIDTSKIDTSKIDIIPPPTTANQQSGPSLKQAAPPPLGPSATQQQSGPLLKQASSSSLGQPTSLSGSSLKPSGPLSTSSQPITGPPPQQPPPPPSAQQPALSQQQQPPPSSLASSTSSSAPPVPSLSQQHQPPPSSLASSPSAQQPPSPPPGAPPPPPSPGLPLDSDIYDIRVYAIPHALGGTGYINFRVFNLCSFIECPIIKNDITNNFAEYFDYSHNKRDIKFEEYIKIELVNSDSISDPNDLNDLVQIQGIYKLTETHSKTIDSDTKCSQKTYMHTINKQYTFNYFIELVDQGTMDYDITLRKIDVQVKNYKYLLSKDSKKIYALTIGDTIFNEKTYVKFPYCYSDYKLTLNKIIYTLGIQNSPDNSSSSTSIPSTTIKQDFAAKELQKNPKSTISNSDVNQGQIFYASSISSTGYEVKINACDANGNTKESSNCNVVFKVGPPQNNEQYTTGGNNNSKKSKKKYTYKYMAKRGRKSRRGRQQKGGVFGASQWASSLVGSNISQQESHVQPPGNILYADQRILGEATTYQGGSKGGNLGTVLAQGAAPASLFAANYMMHKPRRTKRNRGKKHKRKTVRLY